jgi:hypothetical protein
LTRSPVDANYAATVAAPRDSECPKCGRTRAPADEACAQCGLAVARWSRFAVEESGEPPELAAQWERAEAEWSDTRAHDRLLQAASDLGALPSLARRYRAHLAGHAGDGEAQRRLRQIAALVEAAARIQAGTPVSPRAMRALWIGGYAVAALVLTASLLLLLRIFAR